MILFLLVASWMLVNLSLVVGLCAAASRGDRQDDRPTAAAIRGDEDVSSGTPGDATGIARRVA